MRIAVTLAVFLPAFSAAEEDPTLAEIAIPEFIAAQGDAKVEAWRDAYRKAAKWVVQTHKAEEQGDADAETLYVLGMYYANGFGVPQNSTEARKWYRKAAEQGHAESQYIVGGQYYNGNHVLQDRTEAANWWRKAAEQGHVRAQGTLGRVYDDRNDYAEAAKWYRMAAEQGDMRAQYSVGNAYRHGKGSIQNHTDAVNWYRMAAEQGHARAQHALGNSYLRGEGVPQNYIRAYAWFNVAHANHTNEARQLSAGERDNVARKLTAEQVAEAQKLAGELFEKSTAK